MPNGRKYESENLYEKCRSVFIYMYMYINISRVTSWTRRSFDATEVKVELHEIKWIKIMQIPVPRDINNHLLIIQESNALLNATHAHMCCL